MVWDRTATGAEHRVVPDGCMDLIWWEGALIVAGPDTRAQLGVAPPGTRYTGLRLAPGVGPSVFGVPAWSLRDQRVPLGDLWPAPEVRRLQEQASGTRARGPVLEAAAASRLRADPPEVVVAAIVRALRSGSRVGAVAGELGMSPRRLRRLAHDRFGYGPKTLARVFRMQRALELARAEVPWAEVAARSGYADQPHLAREVKALTGVAPGALTY